MKSDSSSLDRLVGYIVTLTVPLAIVAEANPVLAQPSLTKTPRWQMAQSSPAIVGSWRLANMTEGDSPMPMVPPRTTELTAEFSSERISGSGGCNRFFGSYQTTADTLSIGALGSTRKACPEPIMDQETKYLSALQGAQRYEVDAQGQLQIFYKTEQGSGVLRFTSQNVRGLW
ncbi:MAG: META domain-containing protein [Cyanosarcina radialis HA8281-LM2]|jgi:heat shock protein HslJ|nr:META domain-containing protein [Cyanosarcina radialis HA8281-LM2]